ncbi:WapI family immunity protein [Dactylosporangium sp. CA-052675]|uniref:WapI family immunity protein n=1 Tax=Dactylosporangium sp. CA-052675 TaxID=3239927 RepID=UPI003D8DA43F
MSGWVGHADDVHLIDVEGYGVVARVVGYQFPDADDPAQRCSWHMVDGRAVCAAGSWKFRYPALTCDESPRLGRWSRDVAEARDPASAGGGDAGQSSAELRFTESNLSFVPVRSKPASVVLGIGLDLEFAPTWQSRLTAGAPFLIDCEVTREQLMRAAIEWDAEIAPYPEC